MLVELLIQWLIASVMVGFALAALITINKKRGGD